jgi:Leucine-rich repeat (LRR) protein
LTWLPDGISDLTGLVWLYLHDNQLPSLPDGIGDLSSLVALSLHDNRLTGSIEAWATPLARSGQDLLDVSLSDGAGGNNCLSVDAAATATWLSTRDPGWDRCDA